MGGHGRQHPALTALAAAVAAASWSVGPPLPEPRTEVAAAPLAGRIVVVGRFVASGDNSARADAFDPRSGTWSRLPDLPVAVDHAAAAAARGRVYVVGGYGHGRRPLRAAFAFDGTRWRALPPPPEPRAAAAAAATADGRLYVVGGVGAAGLARTMLVYDPAAAAASGRIYAIAGRTAGLTTNTRLVEAFDPARGRWTRAAPVPVARGGT